MNQSSKSPNRTVPDKDFVTGYGYSEYRWFLNLMIGIQQLEIFCVTEVKNTNCYVFLQRISWKRLFYHCLFTLEILTNIFQNLKQTSESSQILGIAKFWISGFTISWIPDRQICRFMRYSVTDNHNYNY